MRLVEKVHHAMMETLRPGDIAIDATAGNGHDVEAGLNGLRAPGRALQEGLDLGVIKERHGDRHRRLVGVRLGDQRLGCVAAPAVPVGDLSLFIDIEREPGEHPEQVPVRHLVAHLPIGQVAVDEPVEFDIPARHEL